MNSEALMEEAVRMFGQTTIQCMEFAMLFAMIGIVLSFIDSILKLINANQIIVNIFVYSSIAFFITAIILIVVPIIGHVLGLC